MLYNVITDYKIETLINEIESGKLGLPELQRPFVWANSKVRDLLDSMIKGYPVGYLMLWDSPVGYEETRQIGDNTHGFKTPKHLIVDGQQRLTSLYAVLTGNKVYDERFKKRSIIIAFNPLEKQFEVTSAALKRSPEWISDISEVYKSADQIFGYVSEYLNKLEEAWSKQGKELTKDHRETINGNITELLALKKVTIPVLDINETANEEEVADIFVRVNSKGKNLKENDFILTLISVHDENLRQKIERFCKEATIPVIGGTSYNQLFIPMPSHVVRTVMAYGFKRARLRYAYMLLRGKDLDTETYSTDLRDSMFAELRKRLDEVLNLDNWHEFLNCIRAAGYRAASLIASENALVYTYAMYLIGKYDYKMESKKLRNLISRWYYMASVTSYYTSSTETTVQSDLNDIKHLTKADQYIEFLDSKIGAAFTNDYFTTTLPSNLSTSAGISPAWYAYCAAQSLLEVKALFSQVPVSSLMSPGSSGNKKAVEKHHLFPKEYLASIGINEDRDRNQIANFAYIEWKDNLGISKKSPAEYWREYTLGLQEKDIEEMEINNALPANWEVMNYQEFLEARRKLMAVMIRKGYECLL